MKKTIALSAISAMALSGLAYSQDDASVSTDLAVSYNTKYVFRGQDLGDDLYTYGIDVAGSDFCGLDWSAGIWYANWDPGDDEFGNPFGDEELDIYGEVSKSFGNFTAALGFIRYVFPDGNDEGNTEVYAGVSTEYAGFALGATVYWNVDADSGSVTSSGDLYYEVSAEYAYDISDKISASAGVTVGFQDLEIRGDDDFDGYAHITATLGASYAVSENISVSPYISYSTADEDYANDGGFYGGVSVGYSF